MKVVVHKGVELMIGLMLVSDCVVVQQVSSAFEGDDSYKESICNWLNGFKNDEIINEFKKLGWGFNAIEYGYVLDENYNIDKNKDLSIIDDKSRGFLIRLKEFARQINFDNFIEGNKKFFLSAIEEYGDFLDRSNYENFMKWFYKIDYKSGNNREFVLLPSLFQVGMCLQNGKVCCASVQEKKNGRSQFVSEEMKKHGVPHTALHEFSHPIINPLTEEYFKNNDVFYIDNDVTLTRGVYKNEGVINDTIIEAILCIYLEKRGLHEFKEERIKTREGVGFYLIRPLVEFLKTYTNNIDKFDSFWEFYPEVMGFLKEKRNLNKELLEEK